MNICRYATANKNGQEGDVHVFLLSIVSLSVGCMRHLKTILQYELAVVPSVLFNGDGSVRKTTKADLTKIEAVCDKVHVQPNLSEEDRDIAHRTDGMTMLQSLDETLLATFEDLSKCLEKVLLLLEDGVDVITIVFDCYNRLNLLKLVKAIPLIR